MSALKRIGLNFLFIFLIVLSFFSCKKRGSQSEVSIEMKIFKAEKQLEKHPDSTLFYTHKILNSPIKNSLEDKELLTIYQLRQKAFAAVQNMDSVLSTGKKIRSVAAQIPDSLAIAQSLLLVKGDIDFSEQQILETYLPAAIATFKKNKMEFDQAKVCGTYGAILAQKGDFVKSQYYLFQSYRIFDKLDSIRPKISICINIGNTFSGSNAPKVALKYYREAYSNAKKMGDSTITASVLMNIGTYFSDMHINLDSSYYYYHKAMDLIPKKGNSYLKMKIEYNLAQVEYSRGNFDYAKTIYNTMLANCMANHQLEGVAMARKGLSEVYKKTNQPEEAISQMKSAVRLADSLGMSYETLVMRSTLSSIYREQNDFKSALEVTDQAKKMGDSLLSLEKQKAVHELEIKYETSKKEQENKHLLQVLGYRQKTIVILFVLVLFAAGLVVVFRQRSLFLKERNKAYNVLMYKYRLAKAQKSDSIDFEGATLKEESDNPSKTLKIKMQEYFVTQKPYLDSKLKLEDIVLQLNVPKKEITQLLKQEYGYNFNTYVNSFRVEELKQLFTDSTYNNFKIESIAEKAGFGSKQSFYNAFETFTGVKPNYYRSQIAEKATS